MPTYGHHTKKGMIAELCEAGNSKRETFATLRQLVESQTSPFVYKRNPERAAGESHRVPLPISEQLISLKNDIGRVYSALGRASSTEFDSEEIPDSPETAPDYTPVEVPENEIEEEEEEEEQTPIAAGKKRIREELKFFLSEVRRIRQICADRAESGAAIDWISVRPAQAAARLIPAGIPAAALLHAMLLHIKPEIRRNDLLVPDFDFLKLSGEIMQQREINPSGRHGLFGYVLVLAEERQPVMLIGPAGTGKSFLARQISEYLELNYGETPMTPGATRGDLLGRMTANPEQPFILSQFAEIYGGGGVFNFEEIDAADPGMLLVLNNALAGNTLFNSANGQRYDKSDDFVAFATANTFGTGANREYTGREKLDSATIDRWRMGRVYMPLDETVEESLLYGRV
jgi:hypothetical protein